MHKKAPPPLSDEAGRKQEPPLGGSGLESGVLNCATNV
jgi:hypothetical protein